MTTWTDTLDAFAQRLAAQEAAVDAGAAGDIAAFDAPEDLGPLPPALAARARDLVWRCRAVEARLSAALTDAQGRLDRLGDTPPTAAPAQPVFFDSRV